MSTSIPEFVTQDYLATLRLQVGKGSGKPGERCAIQEVRAWLDLDASTDEIPKCVSRPCGRFLIRFQDSIKDDALRNKLCTPLLLKLVGSKGTTDVERRRAWIAVDWVTREVLPMYLDLTPELAEHAAALRALPPMASSQDAEAAAQVREAARSAAWKAREARLAELRKKYGSTAAAAAAAAADADADAAAADAAADAADAAAADAADAAAAAAAAYAAADAYAAAAAERKRLYEAALARLNETRVKVWESGARCLERMLDAGSQKEAA